MSQTSNIAAVVSAIGAKLKALTGSVGDLTTLNTTSKASVVAAVNEVQGRLTGATRIAVVASLPGAPDANTIYITTT